MSGESSPLDLARESLEDATLLASRGRRNAELLREVALRQALSAISLEEGLDVSDTLGLDTLLRRVPAVHPQAELVRRLSDPEQRSVETIGRLIAGLSEPAPGEAPTSEAPTSEARSARKTGRKAGRTGSRTAERQPDRPAPEEADGPTAFDASPHGQPRAGTAASATSAAFWALMDRWRIGDLDALALIGHEGGLTKAGTRPRFRLLGREAARYASLRQIDTLLETLGLDADWLQAARADTPFAGRSPLAWMIAEPDRGAGGTIQALNRHGLRSALSGG